MADDLLRSLPDAAAVAERSVDARAGRDRRNSRGVPSRCERGEPAGRRARAPRRLLRLVGGLGADPAAHPLQQGDAVRGSRVPEAKPVTGGRANWDGTSGDAGAAVTDAGVNNFQGRYIIRHYWTAPVACEHPVYDRWGGPPGSFGNQAPTAAKGLATAPRGTVVLANEVRSPVPLLGIAGQPPPRRKENPGGAK